MTHGEFYIIRLDTVSEEAEGVTVESERPVSTEYTVRECLCLARSCATSLITFSRYSFS